MLAIDDADVEKVKEQQRVVNYCCCRDEMLYVISEIIACFVSFLSFHITTFFRV